MSVYLRTLHEEDLPTLQAYLEQHPATTMFMRSNLRDGGIIDRGQPYQATYVGAFDHARLIGVAAHCWNSILLLETPLHALPKLVRHVRAHSGRTIGGIIGPLDQAKSARNALGLQDTPLLRDGEEVMFTLPLQNLSPPAALQHLVCRAPHPNELPALIEWRIQYEHETLGSRDDPDTQREQATECLQRYQNQHRQWVLEHPSKGLISYCAFNAAFPDCVQIGGVWTPPEHRRQHFARSVVAGALCKAHEQGVQHAILFTSVDNIPAQRAYEAIGFRKIGSFALFLFESKA